MDIASIEQRIKELSTALEQSVANHNGLVGRLEEAKFVLESLQKAAEVIAEVVE